MEEVIFSSSYKYEVDFPDDLHYYNTFLYSMLTKGYNSWIIIIIVGADHFGSPYRLQQAVFTYRSCI